MIKPEDKLDYLTLKNWHNWELNAKNEFTRFREAGEALCINTPYVPSVPIKPYVITYPDYVIVNGERVVRDASRPYATDWPAYCGKLEDF